MKDHEMIQTVQIFIQTRLKERPYIVLMISLESKTPEHVFRSCMIMVRLKTSLKSYMTKNRGPKDRGT